LFFFLFKNYNKNRIHSARGAKDVEISLDGHMIFKGEISQACGNVNATNDPSAYGEVCLIFSVNISKNKSSFSSRLFYSLLTMKFLKKSQLMMKCMLIKKLFKMMKKIHEQVQIDHQLLEQM
jgi:hypothetical protein